MPRNPPGPLADVVMGVFCVAMALTIPVFGWEATPVGA